MFVTFSVNEKCGGRDERSGERVSEIKLFILVPKKAAFTSPFQDDEERRAKRGKKLIRPRIELFSLYLCCFRWRHESE